MEKTIKLSELITYDDKIKTLLLLYFEAKNFFNNADYKQSLIIGWTALEIYLKYLSSQNDLKIDNKESINKHLKELHSCHAIND